MIDLYKVYVEAVAKKGIKEAEKIKDHLYLEEIRRTGSVRIHKQ